jgi:hypothetical protein
VVSNSWGSVTSVVATVAVAHVRHVNVNNPTPAAPYTNWATAATVVQHAIDAASAGDEVLVTNGVYSTGINWQGIPGYSAHRVSINKAIRVISVNGPEVTTIYGNTYPRASTGMRPVYLTNGAFLSGFTLTGGDVDVGSTDSQNQRGGGVLCQSPSAVVSNCIISGNRAGRLGGGAYSGTLVDCRITGNLVRDLAGARTGSGGGAYQSVLNRCQISNNSARYSGGGAHGSTMTNCLLVNNSAVWGGGASGSTLVNCTVTANTSLDDGGLGGAGGGGMAGGSALNSIVVANSGSYGTPNIASVSLSYCCTGSNPGGTGNIVADPRFVDPAGGNYRLQPDSPCINAGVNAANASVADLDARPRVVDSVVDMGAFEAQELPWVVGGPASQSVLLNSNVLFTIVAVGREPLAFQWQKGEVNLTDDGRVSGANSTALAISNLVTQDDDDYRIIVSNALGMCTSSVASLTILLPPTLVAQPDDQFISVGTTATFSILASGIPSLSYQWRRNGTNLANGGKISGVTAPVLLVSNVTTNEEAAYDVVVSNPYGAVTSAPALLSLLPLTIVTQPLTQSVPAGTNVSLAVEAVGPYPVAYQWRFGEVAIPDKTNAALSFTNIQSAQSGSYDVVVMDPFTTLTTSVATVTVVPSAPWFTLQPQSRGVTSGETLALVASANGTEPISYQWQREGTNLVGQAGATLTLTNMDSRMGGCYRVIASNEVGVTASAEAQVSVIQIRVWGWDNLPLQNVPASATNLVQISVSQLPKGPDHMVALRADGTVVAWRSDGSPAEPSGEATNAVKVAAGTSHALALRADRTVVAWGSGSGGPPVPPAATNVVEIAVGESWSAAVRADGKVVGWGGGRILPPPSSPPPQATNLVALSGGYFNALGIYPNGAVMQWGGSAVPAAATNVVSVDVGQRLYQTAHNAALRSDGTVLGWGTQYPVPVDATNVMAIAAGDKSALALRDDGRVLSWGSLAAPADLTNAVAIEAGPNHGLAIVRDPYIPVPPPRMGIQPEGASLHTGDSFVLRATLVGAIPARYSWRFNGERVPSLNAPWLYLTNVHPREAGDYVMVASNEFGCVTSAVATVTVAIPEPVLHSLSMTTNGFSFTFKSIDDVLYVTEYSGAVASGPWIELERRFGNGGIEVVADPDIGAAGRFYQVRALYAPPPMLGTATWTGSAVSFSVPTVAGARYVVEYKDDLDEPAWLELEERFGTGEVLQIIDPEPLPLSRFYRVRVR